MKTCRRKSTVCVTSRMAELDSDDKSGSINFEHNFIVTLSSKRRLLKNYMNDSFRTNVFVRFRPETIACACIYLAARQLQIALPKNPAWFSLFDVDELDMQQICLAVLSLYKRKKPNLDELERVVNELKKKHLEEKLKAKNNLHAAGNSTPVCSSQQATPEKSSTFSPVRHPHLKKIVSDDDKSDHSSGKVHSHSSKNRNLPFYKHGSPLRHYRLHDDDRSSHGSRNSSHSPEPMKYGYMSKHRKDKSGRRDNKYQYVSRSDHNSRYRERERDLYRSKDKRNRHEQIDLTKNSHKKLVPKKRNHTSYSSDEERLAEPVDAPHYKRHKHKSKKNYRVKEIDLDDDPMPSSHLSRR